MLIIINTQCQYWFFNRFTLQTYQMCSFQTLNDALRLWITTKLTLINTKIITETISIIVSQLQSKHTN